MPSISELNIRLGLITKDFSRSLKQVEREMRESGQTMSDLGQKMTLGITAPLVAIGAASVRAAGDMEALEKAMEATFKGNKKSIEEAHAELARLRELALAPGIDFEQAVKGSVRLQNVGYEADTARKVIKELANAIALTGGSADDLNEVVNQFAQMIGKGKVFQDDLKIITGRMPVIAQLMKDAFGTTTAEGINKLGISSRQFVDIITQMAGDKLPRVEGGINNAFVNAGSAARQSMAALGKALIETFDITGKLNTLSDGLASVTTWFSELGSASKAFIGYSAAVVAGLGVTIFAVGQLRLAWASSVKFYESILFPAFTAIKNAVLGLRTAFFALSAATQAFTLIAVVAGVTALYFAFQEVVGVMNEATQIEKNLQEVNQRAAKSISNQKVEVDLLTKVLKDNNSTQQEREKALARLNEISPKYFGNLKEEKGLIAGLDEAVKGYVGSITRAATAQAAFDKIKDLANEKLELQKKATEGLSAAEEVLGTLAGRSEVLYAQRQAAILGRVAAIGKEQEALEKVIKQNGELTDVVAGVTPVIKAEGDAEETAAEKKKAAEEAARRRADATKKEWDEISALNQQLEDQNEQLAKAELAHKALENAEQRRRDKSQGAVPTIPQSDPTGAGGFVQNAGSIYEIKLDIDPSKANEALDSLKNKINEVGLVANSIPQSFGDNLTQIADNVQDFWSQKGADIYGAASQLASNIGALQEQRAANEKAELDAEYAKKIEAAQGNANAIAAIEADLAKKKEEIDKKIGKRQKAVAITTAIIDTALGVTKALGSAPPPYNFVLAALTAAAGAVQVATIKAQPFADGGVITQPTLGLVGEYAGARNNPEIITPERLMRSVFRDEAGVMGGKVEVYGIIRGSDIHLSNEKATRDRGRIR